ncbi:MerR-like DNA binding protein [Keratinibaculum paraultunense]|uniref:MerR-like DNA binding protein n=1 Tax=Keratinibaculum paraultunense TaxID=1278232 RepID=A0A4R3KZA8_9FIRM|nr:MerR family transcriptional regulator [Keratinibaculum paraultunense]QQY80661.1 MerR family transcriptional regulator [Keratinibaculum paraultunense]TCS91396.1 MerR-like DNA binding protein [Keratinibaculum paraultunense]
MLEVDKEYSISEAAEITDYPPHVLRYYEKEFELEIPRNESNHRYYTYKEIELFQYIKSLQEQGFSNKQIKLIMNSPELLLTSDNNEIALTTIDSHSKIDPVQLAKDISLNLYTEIFDEITKILNDNAVNDTKKFEELKEEIINLRNELNSKERDVLICENAKLKMKVKEKSYEAAELKEKIKRMENKKGLFQRIFRRKI